MADLPSSESLSVGESTSGGKAQLPASAAAAGVPQAEAPAKDEKNFAESLKVVGGLAAVGVGVIAVVVIVVLAGTLKIPNSAVTGGIAAIASMVGAYFGVKVGTDGTKDAVEGQKEAMKQVAKTTESKEASEKERIQDQKEHTNALVALTSALRPEEKDDALAAITKFRTALNPETKEN